MTLETKNRQQNETGRLGFILLYDILKQHISNSAYEHRNKNLNQAWFYPGVAVYSQIHFTVSSDMKHRALKTCIAERLVNDIKQYR